MTVALTLLGDVRWRGAPVAGERSQALLAALAAAGGRPVRAERLIDLVWDDEAPANATKGLQVLISRTRTACGADSIVRDAAGYRLGVNPAEVDCIRLAALVRDAAAALDDDADHAATLARDALALADGLPAPADDEAGPLTEVRREAAGDLATARVILAQASSRTGAHAEALPGLEAAHARRADDEALLADLLRSEAVVRGPGAALERYERYRQDLLERLGTNPGERLRRAHRDLLALDRPVRSGVRYDATSLRGRDQDLARLRALLTDARVVSIIGPGGLGKTRLAHVLARDAAQPVVHVVELVGVTAAEDVVGEVGSVLGVRDSVSARRTLTPEQLLDLRGRIAQRLGQGPSLLVLDNCEHLVRAVAELVAFLVSTTADLRVLTTSRAPLEIGAEHVYLLGELEPPDAAALFRDRALAARPQAELPEALVRSIVTRLDGLPLAIELAAAKVRAMAIEEIDRRLEDRFALLRGGDRAAPDRHQTLLAVIDWSWNLLDEAERRALRRLALFNAGFTLEAADAVLGDGALDAVQGLVDQSLLSIRDAAGGVRYRMLETVREFGGLQLEAAGEGAEARAARRTWATAYAGRHRAGLFDRDQFATIDALAAEEINLADELRDALADGDRSALVELLAVLAAFWTIRGEHARLIGVTGAVADAVRDWQPPPQLEDTARAALAMTLTNAMAIVDRHSEPIRALLARLGPGGDPRLIGMVSILLEYDPADPAAFSSRLERLANDPDRHVALPALQLLAHERENAGDPAGAHAAAADALALAGNDEGPWLAAVLHARLADLTMHLGDPAAAEAHARAALPVMEQLGAMDDAVQLRALLVLCAIAEARLADAAAELERLDAIDERETLFGGVAFRQVGHAELALARGEVTNGLRLYRECAVQLAELRFPGLEPTGMEPWGVFGEGLALVAHAHHASADADVAHARTLFATCRERALRVLDPANPHLDYPVAGIALFALGTWGLLREAVPRDDAVELLVLAERFAYNRMIPTMAWERIAPHAEARAPGRIAAVREELGERRPAELLHEAHDLVERLRRLEVLLVAAHRQRREDHHHDDAREQRPADLGGDRGAVREVARRRHEVRDRVDVHERLQRLRQRVHRHERIRQERQREQDHHRDPLDAASTARDRAHPGEDPRDRPAGEDRQHDRRRHAEDPAPGAVAEDHAHDEGQARRDQVADEVGDHRAGQRRDPRDRQRLEAVEDALLHVLAQLHARGHAGGQDGLGDDARDHQRQVAADVAGDRAAEDEREHRGEQQRLERHVEELLRVAAHVLQRPPGHREGLADRLDGARARSCARDCICGVEYADGRRRRLRGEGCGAHRATSRAGSSSFVRSGSCVASWPVMVRKTSSRVGLATLTESIATADSRRAISTSAARSATVSGALMRPDSGVSTGSLPRTRRTTSHATAWSEPAASCSWSVELPTEAFSSSGVPCATLRPRSMTAIRSAS